jgi:hypothetical protein
MLELVPAERRGEEFGLYPMHLRLGELEAALQRRRRPRDLH